MRTTIRMLRGFCLASLLAVVFFFAVDSYLGSAEVTEGEEPARVQAGEAVEGVKAPVASNSSSGSIVITMTGVMDDEAAED